MMSWCGRLLVSVNGCRRCFHLTVQLTNRTPLISFPARRSATGEPLFPLSLDKYQSTSPSQPPPAQASQHSQPLSSSYGRKPPTQEEIDAINLGFGSIR